MSEPHICSFSGSLSDCVSVCPCVRLSGWNIMGMRGERNTWLSGNVLLCMLNITTNMHEASREKRLGKEVNNADVAGLNVTENQTSTEKTTARRAREGESEQEREDNGRALEPEPRKSFVLEERAEQESNEQLSLNWTVALLTGSRYSR